MLDNRIIGNNIKKIRELKNYTLEYMADKLGYKSISSFSKIENGETDLTINKLIQISEILEVDFSTILNFDTKNIFNQTNNQQAIANAYIHEQKNFENENTKLLIENLIEENKKLWNLIKQYS